MTKETLKEHYEHKYSHESNDSSIESIKIVKIPVTRYEACVKFFPDYFTGGDILEIGAGSGNVAKTLLQMDLNIASYTLWDISSPRIEGLRRNFKDDRVSILKRDAENIPKSEYGKYDAVILIALLEHLIDPLRAMQNIKHILKPGGIVYIDTPNIAKYSRRIKLFFGRFPSTASKNEGITTYTGEYTDLYDEGHLHYFTYRSLSLMLTERCGFSRVIKLGYPVGLRPLGKQVQNFLAATWPELFSELAVIAYS